MKEKTRKRSIDPAALAMLEVAVTADLEGSIS